jgi:hypothetical protein
MYVHCMVYTPTDVIHDFFNILTIFNLSTAYNVRCFMKCQVRDRHIISILNIIGNWVLCHLFYVCWSLSGLMTA